MQKTIMGSNREAMDYDFEERLGTAALHVSWMFRWSFSDVFCLDDYGTSEQQSRILMP